MKKKLSSVLALVLSATLVIAGCGTGNSNEGSSNDSGNSNVKNTVNEQTETDSTSGASQASYTPIDQLKEQYDVIIVGAGGAGMTTALEAKANGMNPVIFEKMPVAGGNTLKASSGMNASETKFQKEQGIEDSNDSFYEETLAGGKGTNNTELLRYFVDNSADAIDWLDSIGIRLNNLTITGGMSEKRTHRPEDGSAVGQYLVDGLLKNVQEQGILCKCESNRNYTK